MKKLEFRPPDQKVSLPVYAVLRRVSLHPRTMTRSRPAGQVHSQWWKMKALLKTSIWKEMAQAISSCTSCRRNFLSWSHAVWCQFARPTWLQLRFWIEVHFACTIKPLCFFKQYFHIVSFYLFVLACILISAPLTFSWLHNVVGTV